MILKIELAEYCQAFLWLPFGITKRHGFGWSPCHFVHHSCDHFSVRENACRKRIINSCVCLHEKVLFHLGWDTVQYSGSTGFLKPTAKDLHPSLEAQRLLRCSCSKPTQITPESTQWRGLLEDWFTPGGEWRSAWSLQRKVVPCNFTRYHEKLFIPETTRKKWEPLDVDSANWDRMWKQI